MRQAAALCLVHFPEYALEYLYAFPCHRPVTRQCRGKRLLWRWAAAGTGQRTCLQQHLRRWGEAWCCYACLSFTHHLRSPWKFAAAGCQHTAPARREGWQGTHKLGMWQEEGS